MSDPDRVPTPEGLTPARRVHVTHVSAAGAQNTIDVAAAEEPLDVRLHGRSFAVIMRTPGEDRALAAGFLLSERVIRIRRRPRRRRALPASRPVARPSRRRRLPRGGAASRVPADFSSSAGNSSPTARAASAGAPPSTSLPRSLLPSARARPFRWIWCAQLPERLRATQTTFDETGGLHGAALFTADGELIVSAEDVGRHNAVDKLIGWMLLE